MQDHKITVNHCSDKNQSFTPDPIRDSATLEDVISYETVFGACLIYLAMCKPDIIKFAQLSGRGGAVVEQETLQVVASEALVQILSASCHY